MNNIVYVCPVICQRWKTFRWLCCWKSI